MYFQLISLTGHSRCEIVSNYVYNENQQESGIVSEITHFTVPNTLSFIVSSNLRFGTLMNHHNFALSDKCIVHMTDFHIYPR